MRALSCGPYAIVYFCCQPTDGISGGLHPSSGDRCSRDVPTRSIVEEFSNSNAAWIAEFLSAWVKMQELGVADQLQVEWHQETVPSVVQNPLQISTDSVMMTMIMYGHGGSAGLGYRLRHSGCKHAITHTFTHFRTTHLQYPIANCVANHQSSRFALSLCL